MTLREIEIALRRGQLQVLVGGRWADARPNGRARRWPRGQFEIPVAASGRYLVIGPKDLKRIRRSG